MRIVEAHSSVRDLIRAELGMSVGEINRRIFIDDAIVEPPGAVTRRLPRARRIAPSTTGGERRLGVDRQPAEQVDVRQHHGGHGSHRDRHLGDGRPVALTDILGRLPFVLGTRWWVDMDIFQEWSAQLGYDLAQAGIWISAHRTLFPEQIKGLRGDLRYRFESARYSNVDPSLATSDVVPGQQFISSVTPMLTLDRREEPLDPTGGSFHQISLETGTRFLGSDIEFLKGWIETRGSSTGRLRRSSP